MHDCRRIYFAIRALVHFFWHRHFVKRQEFRPFRKAAEAASLHGSQGCIPDAFERRNVSPATVHVERKLYWQLLRRLPTSNGCFLFFLFLYFSTAIGTASYETRQRRSRQGWRARNEGSQDVFEPLACAECREILAKCETTILSCEIPYTVNAF